jgi:hypothetical protein
VSSFVPGPFDYLILESFQPPSSCLHPMVALITTVLPALVLAASAKAATVYLAGDSTMARNGGGSGTGSDGILMLLGCTD